MIAWFVGGSLTIVWLVLRDPTFDVRFLALGSLLPDIVDVPFGGARVGHSLLASVVLLGAVMVVTGRRTRGRRIGLALSFGTLLHLALDGGWGSAFWWPVSGWSFEDRPLPTAARSAGLIALMELAGLAALVWFWRRFELSDPRRRRVLWRTGALAR